MAVNQDKSILNTIKGMLGLGEDYTVFDQEVIVHINTVFTTLNQLGVGPSSIFSIDGADEKWSDFFNGEDLNSIKTLMFLRVKLIWDPPTSSYTTTAFEEKAKEIEWRLNAHMEGVNHPIAQ